MNIPCLLVLSAISLNAQTTTMTASELSSLIEKKYCEISLANPSLGEEAAKRMADAHEYGPLKNGEVNTLDKKRAVDMDLMNNEAGRAIGKQYPMHQERMIRSIKDNLGIVVDNWGALGYYALKFASDGYCSTHRIYTFASDVGIGQGTNYANYDSIEGLKNTNFDLDEILWDDYYKLYNFNAYC